MELQDLRAVQTNERKTDDLQPLEDSFYADVAAYLNDLHSQRESAASQAADPFQSNEVQRLTDEIDTAEEVVEAIYERRVGKVVKQASLAAAGFSADTENMTTEEAELFDECVELLQQHHDRIFKDKSTDPDTGSATSDATVREDPSSTRITENESAQYSSESPGSNPDSSQDPDDIEGLSDLDY